MTRKLWKGLTNSQKIIYILGISFSYGGTLGIILWIICTSLMIKISYSALTIISIFLIIAILFYNHHINKKIEIYDQSQKDIIKEMLIESNEEKKKILKDQLIKFETFNLKTKTRKKVFKNAIVCIFLVFITILFYLVEKTSISMRGVFFGIAAMSLIGFVFNTAYEESVKKSQLKKLGA